MEYSAKSFEEVLKILKEINAKRVFIQFAEGLKTKIQEISKELEKNGFFCILNMEPTYGACDVRDEEAIRLNCDCILHIGHASFKVKSKIPIIYWHYIFEIDKNEIENILSKWGELNNIKKIGLVTSLQYIKALAYAKNFLEKMNKEVYVAKTLEYEGQILGCNISAAKEIEKNVDCILLITEGTFYAFGLQIEKDVYVLDLERKNIYKLDTKKLKKIIFWNLEKFKDAKKVGLLVSYKKGQMFFDVNYAKNFLEKMNKEVYVLAFDEIKYEKIIGLYLDALVNLACPRIIDDYENYKIPIVNFSDLIKYYDNIFGNKNKKIF